jgi:Pyridoxamine 5'-phosphate oxidase
LKAFLEGGVAVVIGTRDAQGVPDITRGWGPQVGADRREVTLCVAFDVARHMLDNLDDNGRIAVTFALASDYRSVQLKGSCLAVASPDDGDIAAVERHREIFGREVEKIGLPRAVSDRLWRAELAGSPVLVRIRFRAEHLFDQTPGLDAGAPL